MPTLSSQAIGKSLGRWMLIASLALSAGFARGQEEPEYPIKPFAITERSGEIGFQYDSLSETQNQGDSTKVDSSNNTMQEYLLYRLNGYVYHPRFLDFRTQFKIGLMQQSIANTGGLDSSSSNGGGGMTALYAYDIYLNFLKDHPLSFALFASKNREAVLELFTDRQMIETQRYGASANLKSGPFPMDLTISHSEIREWGTDSFSNTTYNVLDYAVRNNLRNRIYTELRYRFMDYQQQFNSQSRLFDTNRTTDLQSHDVSLNNTIYFDGDRGSYLNSTARYFQQTGTQAFENTNWQERLNLRHTPDLSTYYLINMLENKVKQNDVKTWRAEAGIEYQLFNSLHTHLDAHGRWVDFGESTEDQTGATARFSYRKKTGWGLLSAGFAQTVDQITRSGGTADHAIIGESLILPEGVNVFLSQPEVIEGTIQVMKPDRTAPYLLDRDYEVFTIGKRTAIRRLAGGDITDSNSAVLVDYSVSVVQNVDYMTSQREFNIRHEFDEVLHGLSLYYRRQTLQPYGDAPAAMNILEFTQWSAGAEYNWRWLTVNGEYLSYRSNFSNYNQTSLRLQGYHRLDDDVRLGWNAGVMTTEYLDKDVASSNDRAIFAGLSFDGHLRPNGYWNVEARVREETGQIDETLLGITGKLGWRWRRLRVEAGGRLEQRKRPDSTRDRAQIFLQVAREFGQREVAGW